MRTVRCLTLSQTFISRSMRVRQPPANFKPAAKTTADLSNAHDSKTKSRTTADFTSMILESELSRCGRSVETAPLIFPRHGTKVLGEVEAFKASSSFSSSSCSSIDGNLKTSTVAAPLSSVVASCRQCSQGLFTLAHPTPVNGWPTCSAPIANDAVRITTRVVDTIPTQTTPSTNAADFSSQHQRQEHHHRVTGVPHPTPREIKQSYSRLPSSAQGGIVQQRDRRIGIARRVWAMSTHGAEIRYFICECSKCSTEVAVVSQAPGAAPLFVLAPDRLKAGNGNESEQ